MKKILLGALIGYALHFWAIELGNISANSRWMSCVTKMKNGEVPESLPSGQHYCLGTVWKTENIPFYEKFMLYSLNLWEKE